jgi:CHAT domain-containing protein
MAQADQFTRAMSDTEIDKDEVLQHFAILRRIREAHDADARSSLFVEGFSKFGPRFFATLDFEPDDPAWREALISLREEGRDVALKWLTGVTYLGSADEDERRARFGIWMLEVGEIGLARVAAKSILCLPEAHPLHDRAKARDALLRFVDAARISGDCDSELLAIADLFYAYLVEPDVGLQLIARGEELFPLVDADEFGRHFLLGVFFFYTAQAYDATASAGSWREKAQAVYERIAGIGSTEEVRAENMLVAALAANNGGHCAAAADAFHHAWSGGFLNREATLDAVRFEARLRLGLPSQEQKVVDILASRIDGYEEQYIAAVERSAIDNTGDAFSEVTTSLAFAYAALDQWEEAVAALERGKSLRLRHQAALRGSPAGVTLLALEEQLHALGRGVEPASLSGTLNKEEDWIGAELSAQTRVLEEYRRVRTALPHDLAVNPTLQDIAGSLAEGEMALLFGLSFKGTVIAGVIRDDRTTPSLTLVCPDLKWNWVVQQLLDEDLDGFLLVLQAGEDICDPRAPLDRLLTEIDKALGAPLAALLSGRSVNRLVFVPHTLYNFIPFWALPSLVPWEVVTVPSAAHFIAARKVRVRPLRKAMVVGDPTADLPISPAETEAVQDHLQAAGIEIVSVAPENATQHELARVAIDCDVVHFCGHGRAEFMNPVRAGLLLRPAWDQTPLAGPEDFDRVVSSVITWKEIDKTHCAANIVGIGHLVEYKNSDFGYSEYFLEYSANGTLWARYHEGQRLQIAQLWTAGDLMVQRAFERCELAFLSACSTSSGGISERSEACGLPGALLLAGVSTIVATAWPVSDVLSALYVDLFYAELVLKRGWRSVVTIVRGAAKTLREMRREEAVARLGNIQRRVDDPFVEFEIDAYKEKLASGEDYPFSHPYAWASFHVLGPGDVLLPEGDGDA